MTGKRTFAIAPLGIAESDLRTLKSLSLLTANRSQHYVLCTSDETPPEIYLVDIDNPDSVWAWSQQRRRHPAPTVLIGKAGTSSLSAYVVKHPIIPSRLLATLDKVTVNEWHFVPENAATEETTAQKIPSNPPMPVEQGEMVAPQFSALIVDDGTTVKEQIELVLQSILVHVDYAKSGEDALSRLSSNRYSIIFLNAVLPDTDGYQLCRTIKKNPSTKMIPVVMLASKSSPLDKIRGSMAGCDTYLTKPVDNTAFFRKWCKNA